LISPARSRATASRSRCPPSWSGNRSLTKQAALPPSALTLTVKDGEVRVEVRAKPRAKKSAIVGARDGALEVAIAARPVDGAANAELVSVLAEALEVPRSGVRIVRGEGGRNKLIAIAGLGEGDVRARLTGRGAE
jgi:uncharacterized protein (TIGR00251 family)